MNGVPINPYALYVCCDAAMDYDSSNTGGVGFEIIFPEFLDLENIQISIGRYVGANIERLELEAILQGMREIIRLFKEPNAKLRRVNTIIFTTDRLALNDKDKTNPYRIRQWRKNNWHNYEGRAIKNSDLLDNIDKARKKIIDKTHCSVQIQYRSRKFGRRPDKLAKKAKKEPIVRDDIALKGIKIGRRKYAGAEVQYESLIAGTDLVVRVFKKDPVRDQWAIHVEISEGNLLGRTLTIYADSETERNLHRHHVYEIIIENVFTHHVTICETIEEIENNKTRTTKK